MTRFAYEQRAGTYTTALCDNVWSRGAVQLSEYMLPKWSMVSNSVTQSICLNNGDRHLLEGCPDFSRGWYDLPRGQKESIGASAAVAKFKRVGIFNSSYTLCPVLGGPSCRVWSYILEQSWRPHLKMQIFKDFNFINTRYQEVYTVKIAVDTKV